jgi:hypothetical protein
MATAAISNNQQIGLGFKEETGKVLHLEHWLCVVLKLGKLGKVDQK